MIDLRLILAAIALAPMFIGVSVFGAWTLATRREVVDRRIGSWHEADWPAGIFKMNVVNDNVETKGGVMTSLRRKTIWLTGCLLVLSLGLPCWAQGFKVYISTDMEGCSGVTCSEQVAGDEGKQLMTGDMNACIEGCFAAGATEVVIRDHHSSGRNVDPQAIDKRAKLIQGKTPESRFKDIEGSEAMILLGYHSKALTPNGALAHSYSSAMIQGMWLNGREVGEIGVDAAIAAEHNVPVVMVSGDDKCCAEARAWLPGVVVCQTKVGTGPQSADVLPLEEARQLVTQKTQEALAIRKEIRPIEIEYPATIRWDYLPKGSLRTHNPAFQPYDNPRRVEETGDSVEALLMTN